MTPLAPDSEGLTEFNPCHSAEDGRFCSEQGVGSPAFKAWFGGSKVVDVRGGPLRVFHGTAAEDFEAFSRAVGTRSGLQRDFGLGHFFASSASEADEFASGSAVTGGRTMDARRQRLIPVYLSLQNPKRYETQKDFFRDLDSYAYHRSGEGVAMRLALLRQGYDGVIVENSEFGYPSRNSGRWFVAFHGHQIKSAIGNRGGWSRRSRTLTEFNHCHGPDGKFCSDPQEGPLDPESARAVEFVRAASLSLDPFTVDRSTGDYVGTSRELWYTPLKDDAEAILRAPDGHPNPVILPGLYLFEEGHAREMVDLLRANGRTVPAQRIKVTLKKGARFFDTGVRRPMGAINGYGRPAYEMLWQAAAKRAGITDVAAYREGRWTTPGYHAQRVALMRELDRLYEAAGIDLVQQGGEFVLRHRAKAHLSLDPLR